MEQSLKRLSWDEVWMKAADAIALRSKCEKAQVGCVIVASDQTVISCSYNGPPPGYEADGSCSNWCPRERERDFSSNYDNCPTSHAEANGIARADWSRTVGATCYVTNACCMTCAKMLASSGVVRVIHRVTERDLHRNPDAVEAYLRRCGVKVERVT